jgi:hypothetical protein
MRGVVSLVGVALALLACSRSSKETSSKESSESNSKVAPLTATPSEPSQPQKPEGAVIDAPTDLMSLVADDSKLYWMSDGFIGAKGLLSVPKTGGAAEKVTDRKQQGPGAVWVTTQHLYFLDGPEVFVVAKTGGPPESFVKAEALGLAAASGDTFCFMSGTAPTFVDAEPGRKTLVDEGTSAIWCKKDGAKQSVKVAPGTLLSFKMLVSGGDVFWNSSGDQAVLSAPVEGGKLQTVVSEVRDVTALAANAKTLFFVGTLGSEKGVYAVDRKGGAAKKLAPITVPIVTDLVADDARVYYAQKGGIWGVPVAGGAPPVAVFEDGFSEPRGLVADATDLYLAAGLYIRRFKKPGL